MWIKIWQADITCFCILSPVFFCTTWIFGNNLPTQAGYRPIQFCHVTSLFSMPDSTISLTHYEFEWDSAISKHHVGRGVLFCFGMFSHRFHNLTFSWNKSIGLKKHKKQKLDCTIYINTLSLTLYCFVTCNSPQSVRCVCVCVTKLQSRFCDLRNTNPVPKTISEWYYFTSFRM